MTAAFAKWSNHFRKRLGARQCTAGAGLTDSRPRRKTAIRGASGRVSRETVEAKVSGETPGHRGRLPWKQEVSSSEWRGGDGVSLATSGSTPGNVFLCFVLLFLPY